MKAKVKRLDLPAGRRVLVVSDIHGNLPLLKGLLDKVGFSKEDILIDLGDILERSVGSLDTLHYMMELTRTHTVYHLLGNCDNVILSFVDRQGDVPEEHFGRLFRSWGERSVAVQMARATGVSLDSPADYPAARKAFAQAYGPELDFLRSLPHILVNDDYIFVHGGVPREDRLEELEAYGCMKNDNFRGQGHSFRRWVIVGHWPVTLYRTDIASAAPIFDRDRHIISIDGGCTLKWDGQLNALILPGRPGEDFTWQSYDGLPVMTALDRQEADTGSLNLRWSEREIVVREEGSELCRCYHPASGREIDILTRFISAQNGKTICEDSTDHHLPVEPGDKLSVVCSISDRTLCKKDGVTGWYFGRLV